MTPTPNPATELHALLESWVEVPAGTSVTDFRLRLLIERMQAEGVSDKEFQQASYWTDHSRANMLLDQVEVYQRQRAAITGRAVSGLGMIESLRNAINAPGASGLKSSASNPWDAVSSQALDWLDTVGQSWIVADNPTLVAELRSIRDVAGQLLELITESELEDPIRAYMLDVASALVRASQEARAADSEKVAALALQLSWLLETYLPQKDPDKRGLLVRLKNHATTVMVQIVGSLGTQAALNPGATMRAIEQGGKAVGLG